MTSEHTKGCIQCCVVKPVSEFGMNRHASWHARCRECRKEWKYPHITVSPSQRSSLRASSQVCRICGVALPLHMRQVDHDHRTGKFRGILCQHCNQGLGCFVDSVDRLERAIEYLKAHLPAPPPRRPPECCLEPPWWRRDIWVVSFPSPAPPPRRPLCAPSSLPLRPSPRPPSR